MTEKKIKRDLSFSFDEHNINLIVICEKLGRVEIPEGHYTLNQLKTIVKETEEFFKYISGLK